MIVVIAISTGMRKPEITTLVWSQINLHRQTITLWDTKNKEPRVIPLVGKAYELVTNLPRSSRKLFPGSNIRYYWEKALKEAGIRDFRFHDIRHTAGSYLAQQGVRNSAKVALSSDVVGIQQVVILHRTHFSAKW